MQGGGGSGSVDTCPVVGEVLRTRGTAMTYLARCEFWSAHAFVLRV